MLNRKFYLQSTVYLLDFFLKGGEIIMAIFLGVHKIPAGMEEKAAIEGYEKYKESAKSKGIHAISAVYNIEKGFAYCQTEAETADQVREAHEGAAVPLEDVIEVKSLT